MKIETKFNVGQGVWAVRTFRKPSKCPTCHCVDSLLPMEPYKTIIENRLIDHIEIRVRVDITAVEYWMSDQKGYDYMLSDIIDENDCFDTEAAAIAEIERRMKK
jgi:hypothetical protein